MKRFWMITFVLMLAIMACELSDTAAELVPSAEEVIDTPLAPQEETKVLPAEDATAPGEPPSAETTAPAQPPAAQPAGEGDQAWMGGFNCGVTLLDNEGQWWGFREESGALSTDQIFGITIDSSGEAWIVDSHGVSTTDGQSWREVGTDFSGGAEAIAIDDVSGRVWTVDYKRASVYDGNAWTTYSSRDFGESENVDLVKDVAIDPQGRAWVATASSVAVFNGEIWEVWEENAGFTERYFIEAIAAGQDGRIWVGHSNGVLFYDGTGWTDPSPDRMTQVKDVAVAPDERVWVATYARGAFAFDGQAWTIYDQSNSGIISDRVRAIAFDNQGRVWLGTTWGLSIFDGANWTNYTMSTSGLAGPCIDTIAVNGNGPVIPQPTDPKVGSLTGMIMIGTQPVEGASLVLCSDKPGMIFSGPHPCADHPFFYEASTNAEGLYTFIDIPIGEYQATWRVPDGKWMAYLIGGGKIVVREGIMNETSTIDATSD